MLIDRRDAEYREIQEGRIHGTSVDFEAGRIGEDTYRACLAAIGQTPAEIEDLVIRHRPFKTMGQVAAGFVSGLPEKQR